MKLSLLSLLITLFTSTIFAQNPDWIKSIGGDGLDAVNAIAVDTAGNIYVTGSFKETVDFDPSSSVSNLTSTGYSDVFLAKYDSIGSFVWAKKMGGLYWDYGTAICLDDLGNILITGAYRNTSDFDPGPGVAYITNNGWYGVFVAKYDNDGNYIWVHGISGYTNDIGQAIKTDDHNNIYVSGLYGSPLDIDPGLDTTLLSFQGSNDVFLAKFNSDGVFKWAHEFGSIQYENGKGIAIDSDENVYLTGHFQGEVDFDPGVDTASLDVTGINSDAFLAKYDSSGNYQWAFNIGYGGGEMGLALEIDVNEDLIITGRLGNSNGPSDFDPGPDSSLISSQGSFDAFVAKYSNEGEHIWAKSLSGKNWVEGNSICSDAYGNVFIGGSFKDTIDLNPGIGEQLCVSNGYYDLFIVQLDPDGNFVWGNTFGNINGEDCSGLAISPQGGLIAVGPYTNTVNFGTEGSPNNITSEGSSDIFIAHFSPPCYSSYQDAFICTGNTYTFPDGSSSDSSMVYSKTHSTTNGCDSVEVINLIVDVAFSIEEYISICDASYTFPDGTSSDTSTIHTSTLTSLFGCDSIIETHLQVHFSSMAQSFIDICQGESYTFPDGSASDSTTIHFSNLTSGWGCDSIIETHLQVNPIYTIEESITICEGESYTLPNGEIIDISGTFQSLLSSQYGCDSIIVTNLTVNSTYSTIESITICNGTSYTLPNGELVNTAGSYESILTAENGCDSVITSDIEVLIIDNSISQLSTTLSANQIDASYQWLDCDNNFEAIPGATEQSYTAQENGNYAVEITHQSCSIISECVIISSVGINELDQVEISIYPNPFTEQFEIKGSGIKSIIVFNVSSDELIKIINQSKEVNAIDMHNYPSGVYFVKIIMDDNSSSSSRIIKLK